MYGMGESILGKLPFGLNPFRPITKWVLDQMGLDQMAINRILEGSISDRKFQTSLFLNPQIFLHIQRELHCNKSPKQQFSRKQHIFGKNRQFFVVENIVIQVIL